MFREIRAREVVVKLNQFKRKLKLLYKFSKNSQMSDSMYTYIPTAVLQLFHAYGRTDGRTDRAGERANFTRAGRGHERA
jgi:hypothetical protein